MNYIKIKKENIILQGITHNPLGEHRFIVYVNENDSRNYIRVNTYYHEVEPGTYECCTHYDRGLCNTITEFRKLTIEAIEKQAYGAWMDGAR